MELNKSIHEKLRLLCERGDQLADEEKYTEALEIFKEAFELIPEPKESWEATTWVVAGIGDMRFLLQQYQKGIDILSFGMVCPNAVGNPFLHLRLGQCQFEINDMEEAADEFTRAYGVAGAEIFEAEDAKYFDFLKTRIEIR